MWFSWRFGFQLISRSYDWALVYPSTLHPKSEWIKWQFQWTNCFCGPRSVAVQKRRPSRANVSDCGGPLPLWLLWARCEAKAPEDWRSPKASPPRAQGLDFRREQTKPSRVL